MKKAIVLSVLFMLIVSLMAVALVSADGNGNGNGNGNNNEDECVEDSDCEEDEECINNECEEIEEDDEIEDETGEKIKEQLQERNRLRFENRTGEECPDDCKCVGRVVKCELEDGGREMTVYAASGNIIVQVKGVNASTTVTLYKRNGTVYGKFKNKTSEIVLPDKIKEKIRDRIRQRDCDCSNMTLTDDAIYQVQTKKKARLFYIFPVRERAQVEVNAENGEIIKFRNPWWGFLAKDDVEE